jgi:hypothetical protein
VNDHEAPAGIGVGSILAPVLRPAPATSAQRSPGRAGRDIELDWTGESTLQITIAEAGFIWEVTLATSAATRALNAIGALVPDRAWRAPTVLAVMGPAAGQALRTGRVAMTGRTPNGHAFVVNPQRIWRTTQSSARLGDQHLGPPGPLGQQARLGDFWVPQRGIFAIGRAFFTDS